MEHAHLNPTPTRHEAPCKTWLHVFFPPHSPKPGLHCVLTFAKLRYPGLHEQHDLWGRGHGVLRDGGGGRGRRAQLAWSQVSVPARCFCPVQCLCSCFCGLCVCCAVAMWRESACGCVVGGRLCSSCRYTLTKLQLQPFLHRSAKWGAVAEAQRGLLLLLLRCRSGVHTHMTNTRITDPEILERRYPVVLHQFRLRPGEGLLAVGILANFGWLPLLRFLARERGRELCLLARYHLGACANMPARFTTSPPLLLAGLTPLCTSFLSIRPRLLQALAARGGTVAGMGWCGSWSFCGPSPSPSSRSGVPSAPLACWGGSLQPRASTYGSSGTAAWSAWEARPLCRRVVWWLCAEEGVLVGCCWPQVCVLPACVANVISA